jgi:hypothetical protein
MSRLCSLVLVALCVACPMPAVAQAPFPGAVELTPGQWVPCSHPLAIAAGRGCNSPTPTVPVPTTTPPPTSTPPVFRPGRSYVRIADGQRVLMLAIAVNRAGFHVLLAECENAYFVSGCPSVGSVWMLPANANPVGWLDVTTTPHE